MNRRRRKLVWSYFRNIVQPSKGIFFNRKNRMVHWILIEKIIWLVEAISPQLICNIYLALITPFPVLSPHGYRSLCTHKMTGVSCFSSYVSRNRLIRARVEHVPASHCIQCYKRVHQSNEIDDSCCNNRFSFETKAIWSCFVSQFRCGTQKSVTIGCRA